MVTELRVHGVSGSSAEDMLETPVLVRVAGDDLSGFYQPRPGFGSPTGPGGARAEAYRWGGLTSGAATRALWLLLLPFMLANLAVWLHPVAGRFGTGLVRTLCRVFALSITATYVLSMVGVSEDLIAWQCASAGNSCASRRSWLAVMSHGFFATPGRRLALCALLPITAIGLLWLLGRRTWARYEAFPASTDRDGDGLASPGFWNGKALVGRLRCLHIATAFATLDAVIAGVCSAHDGGSFGRGLLAASVAIVGLSAILLFVPGMVDRDLRAPWAEFVAQAVRIVAVLITIVVLAYAVIPGGPWPTPGGLPGYGTTVTYLFAGQCALLLLLGLVVLAARRGSDPFLFGLGTPVVGSFSLAVAAAFTAGLSFRVADYLDRGANPGMTASVTAAVHRVAPPAAYAWAALGFLITVVAVILLVALIRLFVLAGRRRAARHITDSDFPGARARDPRRAAQIDAAIADAALTDTARKDLGIGFAPLAVIALLFTGLTLAGYKPLGLTSGGRAGTIVGVLTNLGTYLIGLFALLLLVLGALAYRYAGLRRVVGVLWDIGTFWPRAVHPLAPPCYSERAVPELVVRATYHSSNGGVILSGHSQGSVLVAAAALQMPADACRNVAMLTYGSPIRRLYGMAFPAYVNDRVIAVAGAAVGGPARWTNLWRATDPIGGAIDLDVVRDVRMTEPSGFDRERGNPAYPVIRGHFGYADEPGFAAEVEALSAALGASAAAGLP